VRSWNLRELDTPGGSRSPIVLASAAEWRAVLIGLEPGQELGDHGVKEHVFLVVLDGSARVLSGGATTEAGAGTMLAFEPDERRSVASDGGARLLLLLAPWPGAGHYRGEERSGV
jgi:quercetin dioxygenase-like cupin family protein